MNCGVLCLKRYFELIDYDGTVLLQQLQRKLSDEGLSVASILEVLKCGGIEAAAYRSRKMAENGPYLLLNRKRRHYQLVLSVGRHLVQIYDPNLGDVAVWKFFYRFLWSEYYITLCYN